MGNLQLHDVEKWSKAKLMRTIDELVEVNDVKESFTVIEFWTAVSLYNAACTRLNRVRPMDMGEEAKQIHIDLGESIASLRDLVREMTLHIDITSPNNLFDNLHKDTPSQNKIVWDEDHKTYRLLWPSPEGYDPDGYIAFGNLGAVSTTAQEMADNIAFENYTLEQLQRLWAVKFNV